jgi:hypothetical protein
VSSGVDVMIYVLTDTMGGVGWMDVFVDVPSARGVGRSGRRARRLGLDVPFVCRRSLGRSEGTDGSRGDFFHNYDTWRCWR